MNLRNIYVKQAYSSDRDDILNDFFIPALKNSNEYLRMAGFFSSVSLAVAAEGIIALIKSGGKMKILTSPILTKEDVAVILKLSEKSQEYIEQKLLCSITSINDDFISDHVAALGWMMSNNRLEIKVVIPKRNILEASVQYGENPNILFHQKVGVFKDNQNNTISFSGSINETAMGWIENLEEFKVFRSWEENERVYIEDDLNKFNRFWNNLSQKAYVINIPEAVQKKLITFAPEDINTINLEKYRTRFSNRKGRANLFNHQLEAIDAWLQNNMRGIFSMATGTGKTFAALGCLEKLSRVHDEPLLTIIACPYQHLINQWKKEITKFGVGFDKLIIISSANIQWRDDLVDTLLDMEMNKKKRVIVLITHDSLKTKNFIDIVNNHKENKCFFLIADEVHGLGAEKSKEGLLDIYKYRLGLSATPKRWFDISGTNAIFDFFGDEVFTFNLREAINTINPSTGYTYLTPYRYFPCFIDLAPTEMEKYIEQSQKISKMYWLEKDIEKKDSCYKMLLFKRANIIKNASLKFQAFEQILIELKDDLKWTLVYCSPQQIETTMELLLKRKIIAHKFTMQEDIKPKKKYGGYSERDYLLKEFGDGIYQCLVAMKCLDEGVDIPPARVAILMASSGNPLEYIQRIGRVIRRFPQKIESQIYDFVVVPPMDDLPSEIRKIELKIIEKELIRYMEIAKTAKNNAEALAIISNKMKEVRRRK